MQYFMRLFFSALLALTFHFAAAQDFVLLNSKQAFMLSGNEQALNFPREASKNEHVSIVKGNAVLLWDKKKEMLHLVEKSYEGELKKLVQDESLTKSYALSPRETYFLANFSDTLQVRKNLEEQCVRCAYKPIPGIEQTPPAGSLVEQGKSLFFSWDSFKGTKYYIFTLQDLHGKTIFEAKLQDTTFVLEKSKLKVKIENDKTYTWKVTPDSRYYTNKDALSFRIAANEREKKERKIFQGPFLNAWLEGLQAWDAGFYAEALEAFKSASQSGKPFFILSYAFFRAETKASSPRLYREALKQLL